MTGAVFQVCASPHDSYAARVVEAARSQLGVREVGRNRGPAVDEYVRAVGLDPSGRHPWCMAFVYWCHAKAAAELGGTTSCPRTAGAVKSWQLARKRRVLTFLPEHVLYGAIELRPGDQFVRVRHGHPEDVAPALAGRLRRGHTGIVVKVGSSGQVQTIEGNTNAAGSREGDGVYEKELDLASDVLVGFARHQLVTTG